jgi:hypothetical protein
MCSTKIPNQFAFVSARQRPGREPHIILVEGRTPLQSSDTRTLKLFRSSWMPIKKPARARIVPRDGKRIRIAVLQQVQRSAADHQMT